MKIEGVPDGYELVRIGKATAGETVIEHDGALYTFGTYSDVIRPIVRKVFKVEAGKYYRDVSGKVHGPIEYDATLTEWNFFCGNTMWNADGVRLNPSFRLTENLVEEVPKPEPKYRPFTMSEFMPHIDNWFKENDTEEWYRPVRVCIDLVSMGVFLHTWQQLLNEYSFPDGTPCGVLEKP